MSSRLNRIQRGVYRSPVEIRSRTFLKIWRRLTPQQTEKCRLNFPRLAKWHKQVLQEINVLYDIPIELPEPVSFPAYACMKLGHECGNAQSDGLAIPGVRVGLASLVYSTLLSGPLGSDG